MIYRRLYAIAMDYVKEIAEQMLETIYFRESNIKLWYTLDGREFASKREAIEYQVNYLLEEEDTKRQHLIDTVIEDLDLLKAKYPDTKIFVDTPQGVDCRIGDANIYDDPAGNIVIDCE